MFSKQSGKKPWQTINVSSWFNDRSMSQMLAHHQTSIGPATEPWLQDSAPCMTETKLFNYLCMTRFIVKLLLITLMCQDHV